MFLLVSCVTHFALSSWHKLWVCTYWPVSAEIFCFDMSSLIPLLCSFDLSMRHVEGIGFRIQWRLANSGPWGLAPPWATRNIYLERSRQASSTSLPRRPNPVKISPRTVWENNFGEETTGKTGPRSTRLVEREVAHDAYRDRCAHTVWLAGCFSANAVCEMQHIICRCPHGVITDLGDLEELSPQC